MASDAVVGVGRDGAAASDPVRPCRPRLARRRAAKLLTDRVAALILFLPWLAACLTIAALIWMIDGGPVLFWQERIGLEGRAFLMPKFRTMRGTGAVTTMIDDQRITKLGHVLRGLHVDEWPQLWSILFGRMSFVGPRPEQPCLAASYAARLPNYELRHMLRPGLTGLAQVRAPYAGDLEETRLKLMHDLDYLRRGTMSMDAWILARTPWVILQRRGWR